MHTTSRYRSIWILVVGFLLAGQLIAQPEGVQDHGRCCKPSQCCQKQFNAKATTTFDGEVTAILEMPSAGCGAAGMHLVLITEQEKLEIALGPKSFVEKDSVKIAVYDKVRVKGARVRLDGKTVVLAISLQTKSGTLHLRKEDGTPRWKQRPRAETPKQQT